MATSIRQQSTRRSGPLGWWHRWVAPPEAPLNASLKQQEVARRGRLISTFLFAMGLLFLTIGAVFSFVPNSYPLPLLMLGMEIAIVISAVFNRRGYVLPAGIILVLTMDFVFVAQFIQLSPIDVSIVPLFDLLVIPELFAVTLLPPRSVFIVVFAQIIYIVSYLVFDAAPSLQHSYGVNNPHLAGQAGLAATLARPIIIQFSVAAVTYLWVRSNNQAVARADRAEEIAILEQREIERQQQDIEQKNQLDEGVQQILQTHVKVANGDFAARAPLNRDNLLWQIAYSLNNLLARLQRMNHAEYELQRAKSETARLVEAIHNAKRGRQPVQLAKTGTHLDPLILELTSLPQGPMQPQSPPPSERRLPPSVPASSRRMGRTELR